MINVTKTYLPSFEKYTSVLKRAWDTGWITNNGALLVELEERLKEYLGVKHLFYTNNGTIVMQMALRALGVSKEVITTPFSYVATTNAILWEKCTPVFADIDPNTCCIDPAKIEAVITPRTEAILATHVYGLPCNIEKIESIAKANGLKVIYDGAHAFGCRYKDRSLLDYGDISTCSFHATKLFHTVEGGCVVTNDDEIANKLLLYRQFGHVGDEHFSIGINGKNSEFHAAMGLCVLDDVDKIMADRKERSAYYSKMLDGLDISNPSFHHAEFKYNYSYYPIIFKSTEQLEHVSEALLQSGYKCRRYFYPSLNTLPYLDHQPCPISEDIALRVLCLPLFYDLGFSDIDSIASIIRKAIN